MKAGFSPFLPVGPPTEQRVDAMLAAIPHPPERVVGLVPPCYGAATIEKIAANAVMAGCKPEYLEVLLPVVRAENRCRYTHLSHFYHHQREDEH